MRQHIIRGLNPDGFHDLNYAEWGDPSNPSKIICAHGLTLNGRYFDEFAKACEDHYCVICPDVVGRGKSEWINPKHYWYPQYIRDMATLLSQFGKEKVNYVGTSMGGIIGMEIASMPGHPIKRLVLNDVGPHISKESLAGIADYIDGDQRFADVASVEVRLRALYATKFGKLTDPQWRHLARIGSKRMPEGNLRLAYDPGICQNFRNAIADVDDWHIWDNIDVPILVIRGGDSTILSQATMDEMLARNKNAVGHTFEGIGHAPPLTSGDQIDVVLDFLAGG